MATEAVSLPPSAAERCHAAAPASLCPDEVGMDVPGKCHGPGEDSTAPVILQEREPGAPEPSGPTEQEEAPAAGQSPAPPGEGRTCLTPPAHPGPADASGWPACRGADNSGDLLGDPPSTVCSLESPPGSDATCHAAPGEPKLSAVTEQGCRESAKAAGVETGDGSLAPSPGAEQPAEESANDPRPAGEQGHPSPGSTSAQGGQDASRPPRPDDAPVPGTPSPVPGDLPACSQQGAASARPARAVPRSPVATGDSSGPAHLASSSWAPGGGEGRGEGPAGSRAGGAGDNNISWGEVGAGAVQESEPREVPPGDTVRQGTPPGEPDAAGEPGGARETASPPDPSAEHPAGARETASPPDPSAEHPAGAQETASPPDPSAEHPAGAQETASPPDPAAEDPASAREKASPPDPSAEHPAGARETASPPDPAAEDPAGSREPGSDPEPSAEHPAGAQEKASPPDPAAEDPAGARETASPPDPAAEDPAGSREPGSDPDPASTRDPTAAEDPISAGGPAGAAELAGEEPAGASNLGSITHPTSAGDPVGAKDPGAASERMGETMENGDPSSDGEASPAAPHEAPQLGGETPIEREIRLHQEREETLRRQRGLASPRVTPEYVEVRMKPILSQAQPSAQLPKEKERQWAGAQMQREIQRETRREDDLVQQGKVRGAYDRGTPQELQERKMLFEQLPCPETPSPRKPARVIPVSPVAQGPRGPTFAEANCRANVVIQDASTLLRPSSGRQSPSAPGSPFFSLRPKRPQSRMEQEVLETQERERELQRQRQSLYGWTLPWAAHGEAEGKETPSSRPERPSCGKLEVTWPPPALVESPQQNGLDQVERSPRSLRQKSALIERWESGAVCNHESQE